MAAVFLWLTCWSSLPTGHSSPGRLPGPLLCLQSDRANWLWAAGELHSADEQSSATAGRSAHIVYCTPPAGGKETKCKNVQIHRWVLLAEQHRPWYRIRSGNFFLVFQLEFYPVNVYYFDWCDIISCHMLMKAGIDHHNASLVLHNVRSRRVSSRRYLVSTCIYQSVGFNEFSEMWN